MARESTVSESIRVVTSGEGSGTACTTLQVAGGLAVNSVVGITVALASVVGAVMVCVTAGVISTGSVEVEASIVCVGVAVAVHAERKSRPAMVTERIFIFIINDLLLQVRFMELSLGQLTFNDLADV